MTMPIFIVILIEFCSLILISCHLKFFRTISTNLKRRVWISDIPQPTHAVISYREIDDVASLRIFEEKMRDSDEQCAFQAELPMAEILERYGTNTKYAAALEATRWLKGFSCPDCGDERYSVFVRKRRKYWQCCRCRRQTTVIAGTIFKALKLPLVRWFLAMHLMRTPQAKNNVSVLEPKRHLDMNYKTAWLVKRKLLQAIVKREDWRQLDRPVEIDDIYLGGKRPGKPGRGRENKTPFVVAGQASDKGHPLYVRMDRLTCIKDAIEAWAYKALFASARVVSDGFALFSGFAFPLG